MAVATYIKGTIFLFSSFSPLLRINVASARWKLPTELSVDKQWLFLILNRLDVFYSLACQRPLLTSCIRSYPVPLNSLRMVCSPRSSILAHNMMKYWHWAPTSMTDKLFCGRPRKPRPLISILLLHLWDSMRNLR